MPTGYTAAVQECTITDLKPFALRLARGMGACVMMRDEPWDAPIPEHFEPSTRNAERLAEAIVELDRLRAMTPEECGAAAEAAFAAATEASKRRRAEKDEQRARYMAMIKKVDAWAGAPEGIKAFALQQLHEGMEHDCPDFELYPEKRPTRMSGARWLADQLEEVGCNIAYHTKANAEELTRTDERNSWLTQLRDSLDCVA